MKTKILRLLVVLIISVSSCSKSIEYTQAFKDKTSGKYLFNQDDVIEVFYENNKLFLKWRGATKIEPVVLDENEFFMVDMYKKLRFVVHPETKERYLSIMQEDNEDDDTMLEIEEDGNKVGGDEGGSREDVNQEEGGENNNDNSSDKSINNKDANYFCYKPFILVLAYQDEISHCSSLSLHQTVWPEVP